jgi:3-hydroxyacyl-CoA dehydrogenase
LGYFRKGLDIYSVNPKRVIADAKRAVLELADRGYKKPIMREDIKVLGRTALGALVLGAYSFRRGNYISDHDRKIADKLAYVLCGGDLTAGTRVSEQYLLDLEREAFLSLIGERKTLERMQSILTTGKPLRN